MKGKELEKFKKKWLEWTLNFLDIDPENLSAKNKYALKLEAFFFCSLEFRSHNEDRFFENLTTERQAKMEKEINMGMLQQKLEPVVKFLRSYSHHPDGKIHPIFSLLKSLPNVAVALEADREFEHFQINYVTEDYLSNALLNLATLVDGFPVDSLIKCKGCRKYFIDLTKQKRIYCTSSCAARYNAQIKREDLRTNHPRKYKAYLKEQRERMRLRRNKGGQKELPLNSGTKH